MMIYSRAFKMRLYKDMYKVRVLESTLEKHFMEGKIPGFIHICTGQEAVAVGVCSLLRKDDYILSTHRGHGHCVAKGMNLRKLMAEIFGKSHGCCGGKGGSMHLVDFERGVLGTNGIVGGGIPMSVGVGYSIKMRKEDRVVVCFFGEGASNEGAFHEALNMASLWKLPIIFACENNLYAELTPQSVHMRIENVSKRSEAYDMRGFSVDGNDVLEVVNVTMVAIERARKGEGPSIIEYKTYRHSGHYVGDPQKYKPKEEIEFWFDNDPVKNYRKYLNERCGVDEKELRDLELNVEKEINDAVEFAMSDEIPDLSQEELEKLALKN
jgi:pyruvate dehydrogenase E1 component alpha subunit